MAVYGQENQADIQREVETEGQDEVQRAVRSLISVLSWGWQACLSLAVWLLKQIPLSCGASRMKRVDFLSLPQASSRDALKVQWYPVSVP